MKKHLIFMLALAGGLSVLSCSKDKENEQRNLTVPEQQALIEQSLINITNMIPASDFVEIRGFLNEVAGIAYSMDYGTVYLKDSLKGVSKVLGDSIFSDTIPASNYMPEDKDAACVIWNDTVYFVETSYLLSNFTGHYTATDTMTWAYTKADDLQFIFKDSLNNTCVLKLARQGKEVALNGTRNPISISDDTRFEENDTVWYGDVITEAYKSLSIPEKVILSLSRNNVNVVTVTINTKIGNLTDGFFNVGTSKFGVETIFETNNGYKLSLAGEYDANKNVSLGLSMSKLGNNVMSFNASASPEGIPSYDLEYARDKYLIMDSVKRCKDDINAKKIYVSGTIGNGVKLVGTLADVREYMELSDSARKVITSEVKVKSIVEQLNKNMDLYICFDGSNKQQAKMVLEPNCETVYAGGVYQESWSYDNILVLADGSKVSMAEFFNAEQYEVGFVAIYRLFTQYGRMITTGDPYSDSNMANSLIKLAIISIINGGVRIK